MARPALNDVLVNNAVEMTQEFIDKAAGASSPREAADWALAAKNMAATVHSLMGAILTRRQR